VFNKAFDIEIQIQIRNIIHVPFIDETFIHLGHPLILPANNRTEAYNFIIEKFKSTYKANSLFHAARFELIKSVFFLIFVYYMSNIIFFKKVPSKNYIYYHELLVDRGKFGSDK
jgi:hypothetical protein